MHRALVFERDPLAMESIGLDRAGASRRSASRTSRFARDERGAMVLLTLFLVFGMLLVAGLAIDFTRHEQVRLRLQATTDRCSVGAADLDNPVEPKTFVLDCFDKAGLASYIDPDDVVVTGNGVDDQTVSIRAQATIPTLLLGLSGIDRLGVPARATAEENFTDIEVVMVLDVSGSMGESGVDGTSKMANLKEAANGFLDIVLEDAQADDRIAVSIVTYNHQVVAGDAVLAHLNLTTSNASKCVQFIPADFTTTQISLTTPLRRADHFDPFQSRSATTAGTGTDGWHCDIDAADAPFRTMQLFSNDIDDLKAQINAMQPENWTSIDIGMKWGAALLDPAFRGITGRLVADGVVSGDFAALPKDYGTVDKYLILMTDGANTNEWILRDQFRTGPSLIWRRESDGRLWVHNPARTGANKYCRMASGMTTSTCSSDGTTAPVWEAAPAADAVQLTWEQVWARWPVKRIAHRAFVPAGLAANENLALELINGTAGPTAWDGSASRNQNEKDAYLRQICAAARAHGARTRIYGIAFEAPAAGRAALQDCATPGFYHEVAGEEIVDVFRGIARRITELRLSQ